MTCLGGGDGARALLLGRLVVSIVAEQGVPVGLTSLGARPFHLFPATLPALVAFLRSSPFLGIPQRVRMPLLTATTATDVVGGRASDGNQEQHPQHVGGAECVEVEKDTHPPRVRSPPTPVPRADEDAERQGQNPVRGRPYSCGVAGRTQEALYAEIDLELSWSEDDLPQSERTKHVHRLHPYLGKFIPQLVEVFLRRYFRPGDCIYDPFVGSGTTLVEANAYDCDALGTDISAFNCLLARVKTARHALGAVELALEGTLDQARSTRLPPEIHASAWLEAWYSERALGELLAYRKAADDLDADARSVARVILSRAARSARMTAHHDLDAPREPVREPYTCLKHRRVCRPVGEAEKFLRRYSADTIRRLREFSLLRKERQVVVLHGDARVLDLPLRPTGVITSPPYPGLIDYHEQHRYAYELLELEDRREVELGRGERGTSRAAIGEYVEGMIEVLVSTRRLLPARAPVVIVVNDSRRLYPAILEGAGLELEERVTRHVNRRTGRRAGEYFEDVLVCATP